MNLGTVEYLGCYKGMPAIVTESPDCAELWVHVKENIWKSEESAKTPNELLVKLGIDHYSDISNITQNKILYITKCRDCMYNHADVCIKELKSLTNLETIPLWCQLKDA